MWPYYRTDAQRPYRCLWGNCMYFGPVLAQNCEPICICPSIPCFRSWSPKLLDGLQHHYPWVIPMQGKTMSLLSKCSLLLFLGLEDICYIQPSMPDFLYLFIANFAPTLFMGASNALQLQNMVKLFFLHTCTCTNWPQGLAMVPKQDFCHVCKIPELTPNGCALYFWLSTFTCIWPMTSIS